MRPSGGSNRSRWMGGRRSGPPDSLAWSALYARSIAAQAIRATWVRARTARPVDRLDLGDALREREAARIRPRALGHQRAQRPVLDELDQRRRRAARARGLRRAVGHDPAVDPVADRVRARPGPRSPPPAARPRAPRPGRAPGSRCATRRRRGRPPRNRASASRRGQRARQVDPAAERRRASPQVVLRRPAADHEQAHGRGSLERDGRRVEDDVDALLRREPPERGDDHGVARPPGLGPRVERVQRPDAVDVDAGRHDVHPVAAVLRRRATGSRRRGRSTARRWPRSAPRSAAGRHRSGPIPVRRADRGSGRSRRSECGG